uniref:NADH:ubiquinone reductase (H(+)-translocating) n=1 Tax=Parasagitta elegans TaxID=1562708 RepID=A0A141CL00_9BILA|nr:NADH dehydrogenase subunit 5 [Parasagitta elegans]
MVFLYFGMSVLVYYLLVFWEGGTIYQHLGVFCLDLTMDFYSYSFLMLLLLISTQVILWSYYYMDLEASYRRFLGLVFSFLSSMFLLVFFCSLYGALIGWDGLGVTSFLLVIYFKNRKSLGSGVITALTNRVGDCFLLVLLALHFAQFVESHLLTVLLLLTSMTKSAQFPFSSWLPAAMAAPTPVSALVHSSTLVTAGIYLMIRFNSMGTEWMLVVGSMTMTMAGLCACAEMDLKKIVALSTLSQLGVMVVALSVKLKTLCFFHLTTHAMFKALLFMSVGMGIHSVYGSQDFRSFASFGGVSALPSLSLTVANVSLAGFPFMAGYYSKDTILESFYNSGLSMFFLLVFLLGIGLTTAYSVKMTLLAVLGSCSEGSADLNGGGVSWVSKVPLTVLAFFAVCAGALMSPFIIDGGPSINVGDKLMPLCFISMGALSGYLLSNLKFSLLSNMWFLTPLVQFSSSSAAGLGLVGDTDRGMLALSFSSGAFHLVSLLMSQTRWVLLGTVLLGVAVAP